MNQGFGWNANSAGDNVLGYKIYEGTASGVYSQVTDVGNVTSATIPVTVNGARFFALTAYNAVGESFFSPELSRTYLFSTPPARMVVSA